MNIAVLKKSLFAHNDQAAGKNRSLLDEHGVFAVNIMGGAVGFDPCLAVSAIHALDRDKEILTTSKQDGSSVDLLVA